MSEIARRSHAIETQSAETGRDDLDLNSIDLTIELGKLKLANPVMVASGTFGYVREMAGLVDLSRLGAVIPKTITMSARIGNKPWRTVETSAGLLNSIGLDNDGFDSFVENHLPYLSKVPTAVVVSIAAKSCEEFVELARRLHDAAGGTIAGIELNISCPNVTGGVDFGTDARLCETVVGSVRKVTDLPLLAKLTPNVTKIVDIAQAAADAGADAVCCINTLLGMAVDWKARRPMLGNVVGGLSGPAIKPVALRCVYQVANKVKIPVVGIGGIASVDDCMEFLVAGASAIQIGTANYYQPRISDHIVDQLPRCVAQLNARSVRAIVGTLQANS